MLEGQRVARFSELLCVEMPKERLGEDKRFSTTKAGLGLTEALS